VGIDELAMGQFATMVFWVLLWLFVASMFVALVREAFRQ